VDYHGIPNLPRRTRSYNTDLVYSLQMSKVLERQEGVDRRQLVLQNKNQGRQEGVDRRQMQCLQSTPYYLSVYSTLQSTAGIGRAIQGCLASSTASERPIGGQTVNREEFINRMSLRY
jgi:hypothetical protein